MGFISQGTFIQLMLTSSTILFADSHSKRVNKTGSLAKVSINAVLIHERPEFGNSIQESPEFGNVQSKMTVLISKGIFMSVFYELKNP